MEPILLSHPRVIWHTWPERIFAQLPEPQGVSLHRPATCIVAEAGYENNILIALPKIGFTNPRYVTMQLEEQADGKRGSLLVDGSENIFLFKGRHDDRYALRAVCRYDDVRKQSLWQLLIHEVPNPNMPYGWGSYRPAGTQYCWDMNYGVGDV